MKHTISPPLRVVAAGGVAAAILAGGGAVALASGSGTTTPAPPSGSTSSSTAPAPKVHVPHLDGTVTSVNGSDIVIKDRDGFTRTITTSGSTTYSNGLTSAPAVGIQVHATGTVDANGTALDATTLGAPPTPPAGGHGNTAPAPDRVLFRAAVRAPRRAAHRVHPVRRGPLPPPLRGPRRRRRPRRHQPPDPGEVASGWG